MFIIPSGYYKREDNGMLFKSIVTIFSDVFCYYSIKDDTWRECGTFIDREKLYPKLEELDRDEMIDELDRVRMMYELKK